MKTFIKQLLVIIFALMPSGTSAQTTELEKVSLQLEWKYQFEFAGFIMAKEKGIYAKAGLDVELKEYSADLDIIDDVLSGKSNYGIYNSSIVIHDKILEPIILISTYFQQSPLVFVVSKDIQSPKDLTGKVIAGTRDELKYSSLALLLDHFYINTKNTRFVDHSFNINDFIEHKVDAMSAFRTNQLFQLDQKGIEYNIIDPADYGFIMSALNLFTSPAEALNHSERTRKFMTASNQGWAYALEHPEETIQIIYDKYSSLKSIEALRYEATVSRKMMLLDFFKIGATNKDLSLRAISQFKHSGLLQADQLLGNFIFEEVLAEMRSEIYFTNQQKLYLQNKKRIKMCVDPDWMPFEGIKKGRHIGIAADIFEVFRTQLPVPVELIPTQSWHASIAKAKNRECDIFSLAAATQKRKPYMDFTSAYLDLPVVIATTSEKLFIDNVEKVKHLKLGIVRGYAIAEQLRKKYDGINIIDVKSITDGMKRVENGELYGYIDNLMVISNAIQKDFTGELKVSARLDENIKLAIGTRNDEPQLKEIFELLVKHLQEDERQQILNRWVAVHKEAGFDYLLFWKLMLVILLIGSSYMYHYFKLKKFNARLLKLSITDKLTGLYNRLKMDELLTTQKSAFSRYNVNTAVILLDIDFFKEVNDRFGHLTGDTVLIQFAALLKDNVRTTDYVGRWGGEEFLIVCPNITQQAAADLAEKLLEKIRRQIFPGIKTLTASAGVSQFTQDIDEQKLMLFADKALYQSKEQGRDRVVIAD